MLKQVMDAASLSTFLLYQIALASFTIMDALIRIGSFLVFRSSSELQTMVSQRLSALTNNGDPVHTMVGIAGVALAMVAGYFLFLFCVALFEKHMGEQARE